MKISVGTDIEEISRFKDKTLENDEAFLNHVFTENELKYCFSKAKPAQHLCARFCAKESTIKALTDFDIKDVYYKDIEILKNENSSPYIKIEKYPKISVKVSISHCKTHASAVVLITEQ